MSVTIQRTLPLLALLVGCGGRTVGVPGGDTADAQAVTDAAVLHDASGVTDAVVVLDATPDASFVDSSSADATGDEPATGPSVECPGQGNPATCQPGQYCCIVGDAKHGNQTDTCEPASAPCSGTPVRCAVPADCPTGQVCCGTEQTVGGVTSYLGVSCATTCSGADQRTFCDHLAGTPCPASAPTCAFSSILPGYEVCN
ncbi:MAG TPA: hypothetical protein VIF09_03280 [Polyangiaceae bacterium]|jgi:hypothetical protein